MACKNRIATKPLESSATTKANAAIGNQKCTTYEQRKKWMDAYIAALPQEKTKEGVGWKCADPKGRTPKTVKEKCPLREPIKPSNATGWKYDPDSGRWEKGYKEFRRDDMTDAQRKRGDKPSSSGTSKTEFERGCVGVTNSMAGFPSEDFSKSDCYQTEAQALEVAKKKKCPQGEEPKIFAMRYWDSKKSQRKVGPDGKYPVDRNEVYRAKPGGYVNYDFGYRQSDGSYVHANHTIPGMKVKISPSSKEFDNGYAGFNTVLYCVRCGPCD